MESLFSYGEIRRDTERDLIHILRDLLQGYSLVGASIIILENSRDWFVASAGEKFAFNQNELDWLRSQSRRNTRTLGSFMRSELRTPDGIHLGFLVVKRRFFFFPILLRKSLLLYAKWIMSIFELQKVRVQVESAQREFNEQGKILDRSRASLEESAKLASLGFMASGIAHEINNPLSIILAHAVAVASHLEKEEFDRGLINEKMHQVEQVVMRISRIILGLKRFARDDAHEDPQLVLLKDLVSETLLFIGEKMKIEGIRFDDSMIPEILMLSCRPIQVSQVLLNLFDNAIDAVRPLKEKWIRVEAGAFENGVRVKVVDSGFGLGKEVQNRIFDPFFTTKPQGKGTGLGLSISCRIMDLHEGRIYLDTAAPNTCFILDFPNDFKPEGFVSAEVPK
jgi:C4-dicarboxylate-specific signal transduction histidine kinase